MRANKKIYKKMSCGSDRVGGSGGDRFPPPTLCPGSSFSSRGVQVLDLSLRLSSTSLATLFFCEASARRVCLLGGGGRDRFLPRYLFPEARPAEARPSIGGFRRTSAAPALRRPEKTASNIFLASASSCVSARKPQRQTPGSVWHCSRDSPLGTSFRRV